MALDSRFTEVAFHVGVDEKTVRNIFREYVAKLDSERVLTAPEWIGIDEIHLLGEFRCILTSPAEKHIMDLLPKRDKTTVYKWMMALPNRKNVKVVTMDMWTGYRNTANQAFPDAQCVVDKFHVVRMANDAADSLRIAMKDELEPKGGPSLCGGPGGGALWGETTQEKGNQEKAWQMNVNTTIRIPESWRLRDVATALRASSGGGDKAHVLSRMAVRRLTPRECERLQGMPDDYTLIPYRGKPAADGPRYRAIGNSMAVPVMRWIGERIQAVEGL